VVKTEMSGVEGEVIGSIIIGGVLKKKVKRRISGIDGRNGGLRVISGNEGLEIGGEAGRAIEIKADGLVFRGNKKTEFFVIAESAPPDLMTELRECRKELHGSDSALFGVATSG
jgi:hypothetical protein